MPQPLAWPIIREPAGACACGRVTAHDYRDERWTCARCCPCSTVTGAK